MSVKATPDSFWFMDGHVTVHLARADNAAGISITEHLLPYHFGPPFHVHRDEDETLYLLEGNIRYQQGDAVREASAGQVVFLARGIPHGFRVTSQRGARVLIVSTGRFEDMMRACSRPASTAALPEPVEPTQEIKVKLAESCAANGIDLLGPPIE